MGISLKLARETEKVCFDLSVIESVLDFLDYFYIIIIGEIKGHSFAFT